MTSRFACRNIVRLVVASATILSIGCAASPTAPVTRGVQSTNAASHDDPLPDAPCDSGWIQSSGHWICE